MSKIRVGIAGTGYTVGIANMHVAGYQSVPDCEIVALYDVIPGRAEKWAQEKKLQNVKICNNFEELLKEVDAVSLCVPNSEHIPLLMSAYAAGKHVLCEKPISVDTKTAEKAVQTEPDDKIHMVGFSYRGIPAVRYMKKVIGEGKIGKIFTWRETLGGNRIANPDVKLEWRLQKNKSGTGALADFGCHMVDLCDWMLHDGEGNIIEASGMYSRSIAQRADIDTGEMKDVTNDDSATFSIRFESGTIASFLASRLGVARHTIEVYGEGGMMLFRDDKPCELEIWFKDKKGGYEAEKREIIQVPKEMGTLPWTNAEFREFIDCIKTGRKPERSLSRGLYIQKIIDVLEEACITGKTQKL